MDYESGYIKLHRKMLHWEWFDDVNTCSLFIHLLLMANWEDVPWHGTEIKRGQVVTTLPKLAKTVGISTKSVRTALNHLKQTGEVTCKTSNKGQVITIENYTKYQGYDIVGGTQTDTQMGNRRADKGQTKGRNIEEEKEEKEDKEVKERVLRAWNALGALGIKQVLALKPGTQRYAMLNARIKQYGEDEVIAAIEQIKHSSFLQGGGKNGWTIKFDWFIKPNNFIKVLEGNYSDILNKPKSDVQKLVEAIEGGAYGDT